MDGLINQKEPKLSSPEQQGTVYGLVTYLNKCEIPEDVQEVQSKEAIVKPPLQYMLQMQHLMR